MSKTKTLYVLQHTTGSYMESKSRKYTNSVQKALRSSTEKEAESWKDLMPVPLAWNVRAVTYDILNGRVLEG